MQLLTREQWDAVFGRTPLTESEFDFGMLCDLATDDTLKPMLDYCKANADQFALAGEGSSRIAYVLKDGRCLKVAKNERGICQNRAEARNLLSNRSFFPRAYLTDPRGVALVCECCRQADSEDEKRLLGGSVSVADVSTMMEIADLTRRGVRWLCGRIHSALVAARAEDQGEWGETAEAETRTGYSFVDASEVKKIFAFAKTIDAGRSTQAKIFKNMYEFYANGGNERLEFTDLSQIQNWGIKRVGNEDVLVVIDAGLDSAAAEMY